MITAKQTRAEQNRPGGSYNFNLQTTREVVSEFELSCVPLKWSHAAEKGEAGRLRTSFQPEFLC